MTFDLEKARDAAKFDDRMAITMFPLAIAEIERLRANGIAANHSELDLQLRIKELEADLEQAERVIEARSEVIDQQAALTKSLKKEIRRLKHESKVEQEFTNSYIKRLHDAEARIEELESSLDEAETLTKKNAELMNAYLARIAELEDALVEERAGAIRCEFYDHCEIDLPDAMIRARQELQADGKIGPGARPPCWQITEERKETLRRALEEYKIFPNDQAVLRAMLREAE